MKRRSIILFLYCLTLIAGSVHAQEASQSEREAMYYRYLEFASYVKGGSIEPHWMVDGSSFWFAEGAPDNTVIWRVDPKANTKTALFDTARLRQALTALLGHEPPYKGVPFKEFAFVEGEKAVKFIVEDKEFVLRLDAYSITRVPALSEAEKNRLLPQIIPKTFVRTSPDVIEVLSPDGQWFAGLKEYNVWLRSTYDGRSVQLTNDGIENNEWGRPESRPWARWSPDSLKLALKKVDSREVPKFPVVHWLKPLAEVEWVTNRISRPDAPLPQSELFIVDILSKRQVRVDIGEERDQRFVMLGWRPDGSEMLFLRIDRLQKKLPLMTTDPLEKKLDLMAADPASGSTRVVLTETEKTRLTIPISSGRAFTLLGDGKKFIWMSERDGWNHLYLYDLNGTLIRRLTEGAFPVVRVIAVDEKDGWVYFIAHGDQKRPYDTHLYRVNLKGKRFTRLTEGTGQHGSWRGSPPIRFAPSKEFFLDTHSSFDRPAAVELRRADGTLLQILSNANIDALKEELKWSSPEEFVVKAADGETDLFGILYKPYDFDPDKKYPVIEYIYAETITVPRAFAEHGRLVVQAQALAQLGFITFIVDQRGTGHRGKAFQDVVDANLGEIPDHVATLKQLAEKRPYMDLSRVGIYGYSSGGHNTVRALLLAPDVYHVGIAGASADMRLMLTLVGNLEGKLLLIVGTSDPRLRGIMRLVEALIRAGKPYDLLVFPELPHSDWASLSLISLRYMQEAIRRYFQEHLKP